MRTIVHEVVADIDDAAAEIVLLIHWIGGAQTESRLPKRRQGQRNSTSADIIEAVRQLVLIAKDDLTASILNRNDPATGYGNRGTRERVCALRSYHKIPAFPPSADGNEPMRKRNASFCGHERIPTIPQDRIPTRKIHLLQQHRKMGVVKHDCNPHSNG